MSVGYKLPVKNILLSTGPIESKAEFLHSTRILDSMGMNFYATGGTAKFMEANGIKVTKLNWPLSKEKPNVNDYLENGKIDLVINIPKNYQEEELTNDYLIRRKAIDFNIPLITNLEFAERFIDAVARMSLEDLSIRSWDEY